MRRIVALSLVLCLLWGCAARDALPKTNPTEPVAERSPLISTEYREATYETRFDTVTEVKLSDDGISVNGAGETDIVYTSHDIIYYEDKETYDSGNPYGEGEHWERHTESEAADHTVVNITAPGAYRISGKLSAGQIRVDLGENAYGDENAVVELILSDADITCSVAPAVLFVNV